MDRGERRGEGRVHSTCQDMRSFLTRLDESNQRITNIIELLDTVYRLYRLHTRVQYFVVLTCNQIHMSSCENNNMYVRRVTYKSGYICIWYEK